MEHPCIMYTVEGGGSIRTICILQGQEEGALVQYAYNRGRARGHPYSIVCIVEGGQGAFA